MTWDMRPLSVTILGWLYLGVGMIGFFFAPPLRGIFAASECNRHHYGPVHRGDHPDVSRYGAAQLQRDSRTNPERLL
jgi:hypothetical protein